MSQVPNQVPGHAAGQETSQAIGLKSFLSVDFSYTRQLQSIWKDDAAQSQDLHADVADAIFEEFLRATATSGNVLGAIVVGPAGSGKTHLMSSMRRRVMAGGDWFILLDLAGINEFWRSAALGLVSSVHEAVPGTAGPGVPDGKPQYRVCLEKLARGASFAAFRAAFSALGASPQAATPARRRELADHFVAGLGAEHAYGGAALRHAAVIRAYLLLLVGDTMAKNTAYAWLQGVEPDGDAARLAGLPSSATPHAIVSGTLWMLSRVARTMVVVDQVDAIVSQQNALEGYRVAAGQAAGHGAGQQHEQAAVNQILQELATGLMGIYDIPGRSMTVVSCLAATWTVLQARVVESMGGRFREPWLLDRIPDPALAQRIVTSRLSAAYERAGFSPPYPTWPFKVEAFATGCGMTPRQLLQACEAQRIAARAARAVTELSAFTDQAFVPPTSVLPPASPLDAEFKASRAAAAAAAIDALMTEEGAARLSALVVLGLNLLSAQIDATHPDIDCTVDDDHSLQRPPLTARFVATYPHQGDRQVHVCFRVLAHTNAVAFQARLRAAMTESGLDRALPFRHLQVLRRGGPPAGAKTATLVGAFLGAGGQFVAPTEDDLRTLIALGTLRETHKTPEFEDWLRAGKHLSTVSFLEATARVVQSALAGVGGAATGRPGASPPAPAPAQSGGAHAGGEGAGATSDGQSGSGKNDSPDSVDTLAIGFRLEGGTVGRAQRLPVALLPRHVAILAGAGSGKTVLIRRLVEEAVLCGVPAVLIDSNNDLSMLGERWPTRPPGWLDAEAARAQQYHELVDVVVWTPGISAGRSLVLDVLPDFRKLADADVDQREQAVQMGVSTLASIVHPTPLRKGVLADAIRAFSMLDRAGLVAFCGFLKDLPDGVSLITNSKRIAGTLADQLHAAISTNPLLRPQGNVLDPRVLFESDRPGPAPGRMRVRVSVVSLVGLPSDEAREEFVNRLQMALFTFIKQAPSATGRLYVMDEARNFIPSSKSPASRDSAVSLVAQARKYGLGVVLATQTPRDIDNKAISNCTTQFYGKMSSPAAIATIKDLVAAKGGAAPDIAALPRGVFYFSTEGQQVPVKIQTSLCLSYHPANPPSNDEVVRRAGLGAGAITGRGT